jgi:hypothetical protein
LFNHLGCILYDGREGARSIGLPLTGVFGVFMPESAPGSFAERLGFDVAEI